SGRPESCNAARCQPKGFGTSFYLSNATPRKAKFSSTPGPEVPPAHAGKGSGTIKVPPGPLHFEPILKRLIWGGRRLGTLLGKPLGDAPDYAESWEVADHRDDVSRVANGPLAGASIRDLVRNRATEILGSAAGRGGQFPLLVKFLDAHQVLSVQVHPDDER